MNIIGHEITIQNLIKQSQQNQLPHSLLFCGPDGVGKSLVAQHLVMFNFCEQRNNDLPCYVCSSCQRVLAKTHPDLLWIEPEKEVIKIESIRQLKQWAILKPLEGNRKFVVLNDAHTLQTAGANALLKSLEEPPSSLTLILITAYPYSLLKTILSRCQKIPFHSLSSKQTAEILLQNPEIAIDPTMDADLSPGQWKFLKPDIVHLMKNEVLPALNANPRQLHQLLEISQQVCGDAMSEKSLLTLLLLEFRKRLLNGINFENLEKFKAIQFALKNLDKYANSLLTFENLFLKLCL